MLEKQFIQILPQDNVASGRKMPYAEHYNLANDLCIFNPAPIT